MIAEPMYCAEQINIPDNLGEILKAYAKEVIRQQPGNLYEFSARYFAQAGALPPLRRMYIAIPALRASSPSDQNTRAALIYPALPSCCIFLPRPASRAHRLPPAYRAHATQRLKFSVLAAMCCVVQLDQQEDDFVDNGDAEISREIVFRLVMACNDAGREEIEVGNLRELCEQSGVPLGATSGILELILPPDDTSGRLPWKHFVVALCAQVGGVEDVTGFVRLLLDPGMFGNDEGQISKTDFITLIDWWSSIDTSISAELKSALFTALNPTEEEELMDYTLFMDALKNASGE
eukprot:CAMPEP_0179494480 /NCGR_PEP_ID=MMETSP0799-20121207/68192_1 /TAXON_ID=46947 /ORGANISM="Geminigera cryophila, Strain CCMP2564" /LENGTH=291 /DNA_ID=CAMNT_0021312097 /DNA_START=82 /DNA_END=959 /DNA_ORIENTATION=-